MRPSRYILVFVLQLLLLSTAFAQTKTFSLFGKDERHTRFSSIAMSPDGKQIVISADNLLYLFDTTNERVIRKIPGSYASLKFSDNGQRIFGIGNFERRILDSSNLNLIVANSDSPVPGKVGVRLAGIDGSIVISQVLSGSPVQKTTKIEAGDELIGVGDGRGGRIDKVSSVNDAVNKMGGPAGAWLRVQVREKRSGELREYKVQRLPVSEQFGSIAYQQRLPNPAPGSVQYCFRDKNRIEISSIDDGTIHNIFSPTDVQAASSRTGKTFGNCAMNSDGSRLAILSSLHSRQGNAIEIYDTSTGERIAFAPFLPSTRSAIGFSEDESKIFATSEDTLEIIDIEKQTTVARLHLRENYKELRRPTLTGQARMIASKMVVLNNGIVATANQWGQIHIWDMQSGELTKTIEHGKQFAIDGMCKSHNGETLCWYSKGVLYWAGTKELGKKEISGFEKILPANSESERSEWNRQPDFGMAELVETIMTGPNVNDYQRSTTPFLQFSKDGQRLFVGGKVGFIPNEPVKKPTGRDSKNQAMIQYLAGLESRLERLDGPQKYKVGGELRAASGFHGNMSSTVDVYETASGNWLRGYKCLLRNKIAGCRHGAVSPDDRRLAVVAGEPHYRNVMQFFADAKVEPTVSLEHYDVGGVVFMNDSSKLLAFFPGEDQISMIDAASGEKIPDGGVRVSESKFGRQIGLALSPNGSTFVLGALQFNSRTARLKHSLESGNWRTLDAFDGGVTLGYRQFQEIAVVEGDKSTLIEGGRDRVIDAKFSADGEMFAVASGNKIELWDRRPLQLVTTIEDAHARRVNSVAFSPTSPLLASNSQDGSTRIWNISKALKQAATSK